MFVKKVTFYTPPADPKAPKQAIKLTPSKEDRDRAQELFLQYDEELEDAEILLEEIEEHGPKPNFLMFCTTKESQISYCEREIERLKQWRSYYLDLM